MAYSLQSRTVQEAVAPYWKSVAADTTNGNDVCRAIMNNGAIALSGVTVTFADGSTADQTILAGVIYPYAAIKVSNAAITFLY